MNAENVKDVFQVGRCVDTLRALADAVAEELEVSGPADVLAPDLDEYRLSAQSGSGIVLSTELRVAPGVYLPVEARFYNEVGERQIANIRMGVRELLKRVGEELEPLLRRKQEIEQELPSRLLEAQRLGVNARLLDVTVAPLGLIAGAKFRVAVTVEGATCNMLRPYRKTIEIEDADDLDGMFEVLVSELKPIRRERLAVCQSHDAIGLIDTLALSIIDAMPEGREAILRKVARRFEHSTWLDMGGERPEAFGLRWYDGVVRAYAPLSGSCHREWETIDIGSTMPELLGQSAAVLCDHPALADLTIVEVVDEREVRVTDRLLPFTADGKVLDG